MKGKFFPSGQLTNYKGDHNEYPAPEGNETAIGPPPGGGPPPEEADEDDTSLTLVNAMAISMYENVSANFMSIMTEDSDSYRNNPFTSLVV